MKTEQNNVCDQAKRNDKVKQFLSSLNTEIDILNLVTDLDEVTDFYTLFDAIQDNNGFDMEVIYHATALEYLLENDPSLSESLALADEHGYNVLSLSSEILASLLKSRNVMDDFNELEDEINNFFEGLDEDESNFENYSVNTYEEADNFMMTSFNTSSKEYLKFESLGRTDEAIEYAHELGYDIED